MPRLIGCIPLPKIYLKVDIENDIPASTFIFKCKMVDQINRKLHQKRKDSTAFAVVEASCMA